MAFVELLASRQRNSRTYQDDTNPQKRALDVTLAALHYESVADSGVYDAAIDCTPQRVQNAQLDGWRVTQSGWHYALGQPSGKSDGWVGFGGRQGQNWLQFRLLRVGYLRWSTRAWRDIGGAPSYSRANLTSQVHSTAIGPNGDTVNVGSKAVWSNIWTTPGGGALDISWRVNGNGLKEEITINQAAREWLAANRPPTTPLTQTWFGFVFEVDWSDVPKVVKANVAQDMQGDFADDGESIELRDSLDRLLGFMPVDNLYVPSADPMQPPTTTPLRKRFYRDADGKTYLLVGVRCDVLNGLPDGDLVFDPTIDVGVGASGDDGYITGGAIDTAGGSVWAGGFFGTSYHVWFHFTGISGLSGATIDVAHITNIVTAGPDSRTKLYADKSAAPAAPTTAADYNGRTTTTAAVDWDVSGGSNQTRQSPSIVSVIQELADSYDPSAILILQKDDASPGGGDNLFRSQAYDFVPANASQLHIEYTAAGGGTTYYSTLSGTLSSSATMLRQAQKGLSASESPTAALLRQAQNILAGSVAASGSLVKQGQKATEGTLSSSGTFAGQGDKALGGTVASSGDITRQADKALSGDVATDGALNNQGQKALAGNVAASGAFNAIKAALLSIGGTIPSVGALTKEASKALTATLGSAGSLINQGQKALAGLLASSGALASEKVALVSVTGAVVTAGALVKQASSLLGATATTVGALTKSTSKASSGTLSTAGDQGTTKVSFVSLAGSAGIVGTIVLQVAKSIGGTVTLASAFVKLISRPFSGAVGSAGSFAKQAIKAFTGNFGASGELVTVALGVIAARFTFVAPAISRTFDVARTVVFRVPSKGNTFRAD